MSSTLLAIVGLVVAPLLTAECSEVAPWLAAKILRWSARRLRDQEKVERYTEEWLANLEHVPGKLTKLGHALGVATLGIVHLRTRAPRLDWEPRPVVVPFETDSLFGQGTRPVAAKGVWRATVQPLTYRPVDKDQLYPSRWSSAVIDWWPEPKPRRRRRPVPTPGSGQWFSDTDTDASRRRRREPDDLVDQFIVDLREFKACPPVIGL